MLKISYWQFLLYQLTEKRFTEKIIKYPVEVKLLPSLSSIVEGNVSIENIRHVEVQDILGRVPVSPKSILF